LQKSYSMDTIISNLKPVNNKHSDMTESTIVTQQDELLNVITQHANSCKTLIDMVSRHSSAPDSVLEPDLRWLAIAQSDLQKGFMALKRSVEKPDAF